MERSVIKRYTIKFKGLKAGEHTFQFKVDEAFFAEFDKSHVSSGDIEVQVVLVKHTNMLNLRFSIEGTADVPCDRCLEFFAIPLEYSGEVIIKISDSTPEEYSDEIWSIGSNEHEVNIAQYLYESICLSLPIQRYHGILGTSADDCDFEMISKLNKLAPNAEAPDKKEETDSRWDKLKGLMNN